MSIALGSVSAKRVMWAAFAVFAAFFIAGCSAGTGSESSLEEVGSTSSPLCSGMTISAVADPGGVKVTASGASCAVGETPEYAFYYLPPSGGYVLFRPYGTSPVAIWDTSAVPAGSYQILAAVRAVGQTSQTYAYLQQSYKVGSSPSCTQTNTFTQSPPPPQSAGTHVTLTATASCGSGTGEFQYLYYPPGGSGWVYLNNGAFTSAPLDWNTTGLPTGNYTLLVFSRAQGNTGGGESYMYGSYVLGSASSVCSTVSYTISPQAPQPAGTALTINGSASPCSNPEYAYWYRLYGTSPWTAIRGFGPAQVIWNTPANLPSGQYEILVGARNVGSAGGPDSYYEIAYAIGSSCSGAGLIAAPASPQLQGTSITLTGSSTCPNGASAEYAFYYLKSGDQTRTLIRAYGAASASWDTSALTPGTYQLTVFARAVGNASDYDTFAQIGFTLSASTVTQVATGFGYHACAVSDNGRARCWGRNTKGQLGNGGTTNSSTPVLVTGLANASAIAIGLEHTCAVLADHSVSCWGEGSLGQLGNGGTTASSTPVAVTGITDATAISAGMNHTCVLRTGGAVSCWGYNAQGQVGDSTASNFPQATAPVAVVGVSGASAIAVGGFHSCALVSGAVSCWGDNSKGQLGTGGLPTTSFAPIAVSGLSGVTNISGGEESSCAVSGGGVSCWGDNIYGQLGDGSKNQAASPLAVPGLSGVAQVSAGYVFSCARLAAGGVSCWGRNDEGELGNGSSTESLSPVAVSGISTATQISAGSVQSCALLASGTVQCWGYNGYGQIGNGTTTDAHTPVTVPLN